MKWNLAFSKRVQDTRCEQKMVRKMALIVLFSTLLAVQGLAHDFWVDGYNSSVFRAHIGYGHRFPEPEKIPEDRVKIFESLVIIDKYLKSTTLKNIRRKLSVSRAKST